MADEQGKKPSKKEVEAKVHEPQVEVKQPAPAPVAPTNNDVEKELKEKVQALEKELLSRPSQADVEQLYSDIERGVNERVALAKALEDSRKEMSLMRQQANQLTNVVQSNVRPDLDVKSEVSVRKVKHAVAYVSSMKDAVDLWRKRYANDDDLVLVLKGM
jgi:hypothetical protein